MTLIFISSFNHHFQKGEIGIERAHNAVSKLGKAKGGSLRSFFQTPNFTYLR